MVIPVKCIHTEPACIMIILAERTIKQINRRWATATSRALPSTAQISEKRFIEQGEGEILKKKGLLNKAGCQQPFWFICSLAFNAKLHVLACPCLSERVQNAGTCLSPSISIFPKLCTPCQLPPLDIAKLPPETVYPFRSCSFSNEGL